MAAIKPEEPIAIIGMGCRLPGGIMNTGELWDKLISGYNAVTTIPGDRWNKDQGPVGKLKGCSFGSFIENLECFDPKFFGLTPKEAKAADPQLRVLLEVVYETFFGAGYDWERFRGSETGVFVGHMNQDWWKTLDYGDISGYTVSVIGSSNLSGRISYTFNLQGPCISLDTACSSSLTCVDLAVEKLLRGDCRMAIAAGVNLILSPFTHYTEYQAGMLSPTGRSGCFDENADGMVRGEGCGAVLLKPLSIAVADGDNILAVIKGSSLHHGGNGGHYTVPNRSSQVAVLRRALIRSNISPAEINYVEAHATGTVVGDPIEIDAMYEALELNKRDHTNSLIIGSHKANFGHLESASGMIGLIKAVLVTIYNRIPPNIHLKNLNPKISSEHITLPTEAMNPPERIKVVGVSAFGLSGSTAHVLISKSEQDPNICSLRVRVNYPMKKAFNLIHKPTNK